MRLTIAAIALLAVLLVFSSACGSSDCAPGCPDYFIGDGGCDSYCNNAACGFDNGDCATTIPTATPTRTVTPIKTVKANTIDTASSLDFTAAWSMEGYEGGYTKRFRARNIGTDSFDMRVDTTYQSQENVVTCIIRGASQQGWIYDDEGCASYTAWYPEFETFWSVWYDEWNGHYSLLSQSWIGQQPWVYTAHGPGMTTYTNIIINPSLPESLFQCGSD